MGQRDKCLCFPLHLVKELVQKLAKEWALLNDTNTLISIRVSTNGFLAFINKICQFL